MICVTGTGEEINSGHGLMIIEENCLLHAYGNQVMGRTEEKKRFPSPRAVLQSELVLKCLSTEGNLRG